MSCIYSFISKFMILMKWLSYAVCGLLLSCIVTACGDDDLPPATENPEETITTAILTFQPEDGGDLIEVTWEDADGEGSGDPVIDELVLAPATTYRLTLTLFNRLDPANPVNISDEVRAEGDEHMLFFAWTDGLFADPTGDGNIDERDDPVNYQDTDAEGLPLGLVTRWNTGAAATGMFRVVLKHQPGIKSATSVYENGASDIDIAWPITIQ